MSTRETLIVFPIIGAPGVAMLAIFASPLAALIIAGALVLLMIGSKL